ncbi:MAG: thioredoxin-disulfide reductase [Chloroflexota bacterium]
MSDTNITMYGANWCGDCRQAKKFLGEHRIHYRWVDVEQHPEAQKIVEDYNDGKRIIPTIVFEDGSILVEPSNAELATKLGLQTKAMLEYYDVIVIGSGPAGLTAALYSARDGLDVLVVEKGGIGGQAGITDQLDNFPGFPEGVTGGEFADRLAQQARRFGVEILQAQEVTQIRSEAESCYVTTASGDEYGAQSVLLATGATYRRLHVPGEESLIGAGVHFCATCDGPFYKDQHVVVVGGGHSAAEEGIFLTRFASKVTMLVRGDSLKASPIVMDKIDEMDEIEVLLNTEVVSLDGENELEAIHIRNNKTGETSQLTPDGAFVFIGMSPNSAWVPEKIERNEYGFILTDKTLATSVPGVFAAGDVREGATNQAASAAGEGATAALMIREYLKEG